MRILELKRVLGIDPGSQRTGWGVVESTGSRCQYVASGVIDLRKIDGLVNKLGHLSREIETVLGHYKPTAAAIEAVFHGKNAKSALVLGQARGAAIATLGRTSVECVELSPAEIKLSVAGHGAAGKEQVAQMVERLLDIKLKGPSDEFDALAVAIAGGALVASSTREWMSKHGLG